MTPTIEQIRAAKDWLAQRGGSFYPSASEHVTTLLLHIEDLESQIENLLLQRRTPMNGEE